MIKNLYTVKKNEIFALVRPALDAHTLGVSSVSQLIEDCGLNAIIADAEICKLFTRPKSLDSMILIEKWLKTNRIDHLGFSYRLDPADGVFAFGQLIHQLKLRKILKELGGSIKNLYFAGLPPTCKKIESKFSNRVNVFFGDETPEETLEKLGIPKWFYPMGMQDEITYDKSRLNFARDLINNNIHSRVLPIKRSSYNEYATPKDTVIKRINHSKIFQHPPLMRSHVGPYMQDRAEAIKLYLSWTKDLARTGFLDILSIGSSQLTQSNFGEDWGNKPNGGGVPINSIKEFRDIYEAAKPMLVRTYAGTKNISNLAKMYESTINIAWHTFSLWWFCKIDGRGSLSLKENLEEYFNTFKFIANSNKPFEPNIPHHFSFRGGDDTTYVLSAVLAARAAKAHGIKFLILQIMLNTPKFTSGIQDLAKARATLKFVRELEDNSFQVFLQPRAGLDYFSHDLEKAKKQLAAVSAMMDDIEPSNYNSPEIIHVVNYSEGSHLADPKIVDESIKITRAAISEYRKLKARDLIDDMVKNLEVDERTQILIDETKILLKTIEKWVPKTYSAQGFYKIFCAGFLPTPFLWGDRELYTNATNWKTKLINGSIKLVDRNGTPYTIEQRISKALDYINSKKHNTLTY